MFYVKILTWLDTYILVAYFHNKRGFFSRVACKIRETRRRRRIMALERSKYIVAFIFALAAVLLTPVAKADEAVVMGANSDIGPLTQAQVRELFLGMISSLPDGATAVLVDLPESSPARNDFYLKVTNKTAAQASALWAKLYFTGRGVPPLEAQSTAEVKALLNRTPGSIGYIDAAAVDRSVKVIFIVK